MSITFEYKVQESLKLKDLNNLPDMHAFRFIDGPNRCDFFVINGSPERDGKIVVYNLHKFIYEKYDSHFLVEELDLCISAKKKR